jgi:hypothetical protein
MWTPNLLISRNGGKLIYHELKMRDARQIAVFPAIGVAENQTGFPACLLKAKNTYQPTRAGASNNRCFDTCRAIAIELKCKRPNGSHSLPLR